MPCGQLKQHEIEPRASRAGARGPWNSRRTWVGFGDWAAALFQLQAAPAERGRAMADVVRAAGIPNLDIADAFLGWAGAITPHRYGEVRRD